MTKLKMVRDKKGRYTKRSHVLLENHPREFKTVRPEYKNDSIASYISLGIFIGIILVAILYLSFMGVR